MRRARQWGVALRLGVGAGLIASALLRAFAPGLWDADTVVDLPVRTGGWSAMSAGQQG
mgnify:CR=1 FL=1